jgi:flagellar M-ring protein FliF
MNTLLLRWNALAVRARIFGSLVAVAALAAVSFAIVLQRDTSVALFAAPLQSEQVTEVVGRLAEWNVPFVPQADNVRVSASARNSLLLKLSLAGLPHAHLNSSREALAAAGPLTPQSVLDAQARDGLAGDLASGLRGLPGVEEARVIIAPERSGSFADESTHAATASVRLTLAPGAPLSRTTVEGIRQFVAAGVSGLDPRRVAILDDRGFALGEAADGPGTDEAQALQQSLQSALDVALGAGASIVRVRVAYDPRVRELHDTVRKPFGSRAIGTTTSDESYKSATKTYAKQNATVDRGSEVEDERVDTPGGRVERISVAIALDASLGADAAKIRSLAAATLGLQRDRGDSVAIEALPFARSMAPRASPFGALLGFAVLVAPSAFSALALVLAVRFGAKPAAAVCEAVAARIALSRTARTVAAFAPAHVRGALAGEPPHTAAAIISALPAATATAVLEMYPAEERAAIVRRMSRQGSPVIPDFETVLRRG